MYRVFESWMVTEYHRQYMDDAGGSLSDMFGLMTTLNGVIAIVAGLFTQAITDFTRTQSAPFMSSIFCFILAFSFISNRWLVKSRNFPLPFPSVSHELWDA
jgi:hypothetical protein